MAESIQFMVPDHELFFFGPCINMCLTLASKTEPARDKFFTGYRKVKGTDFLQVRPEDGWVKERERDSIQLPPFHS